MKTIWLSLQDAGNGKKRFGISSKISSEIFKGRYIPVEIRIDDLIFQTETTCGIPYENGKPKTMTRNGNPYKKKGYDLYSREISNWIIENENQFILKGKSKRIIFTIVKVKNKYILTKIINIG